MSDVIGIPPMYANLPSCAVYLRPTGSTDGTVFRDWSPYHATITNSGSIANAITQVKFNPCSIQFNGSNHLSILANSRFSLLGTNDWAISYWWYWDGTAYYLIGYGGGGGTWSTTTGRQWNWVPQPSTNSNFQFNNAGAAVNNTFNLNCPTGAWSHIALINRGSTTTCHVYVNGVQQTTVSTATMTTAISSPSALNIGCSTYSGDGGIYNGPLDELAIWNGALGVVPEITDLYTSTKPYPRRLIL